MPSKSPEHILKRRERDRRRKQKDYGSVRNQRKNAPPSDGQAEAENHALVALLRERCFDEIEIPGDGNCLFSSVLAVQKGGIKPTIEEILELRRLCSNELLEHEDLYCSFFVPEMCDEIRNPRLDEPSGGSDSPTLGEGSFQESYKRYCHSLCHSQGAWGGALELSVLAAIFGVTIIVLTAEYPHEIEFQAMNKKDHQAASEVIFLVYRKHAHTLGCHYNGAIRRKEE